MEDLALDGPALEQQPLRSADEIEPGREERPDRRRRRELAGAPLAEMGQELLEEQRVPPGAGGDPRQRVVPEPVAGTQGQELTALAGRERAERERDRVPLAACPGGTRDHQLRPGEADDEHRRVPDPVREVVDEVEERGLAPVRVLDDEHERTLPGEPSEQPAERPKELFARRAPLEAQRRRDGARHGRAVLETLDELVELAVRGRLLDDLADRPVRDAVAVRRAAADEDGRGSAEQILELPREPRLPDPGLAEHGDELAGVLGDRPVERVAQQAELALSAHERRVLGPRPGQSTSSIRR